MPLACGVKIWSKRESPFQLLGWGLGLHTHVPGAGNGSILKSGGAELRIICVQQCVLIEDDRKDH